MWYVSTNRHRPDQPFRFTDLLLLQTQTLEKIRPQGDSALLFAELAPTITLGARQILQPEVLTQFHSAELDVVAGERGGNETWHGPGQWVGFVLTPLQEFTGDSKGVRRAVEKILENVLSVAKRYEPTAHLRKAAELGVWSNDGKLASVGIKIRQGYVTSGFALNCVPSDAAFLGISPCGIEGARPDFIFRHSLEPSQFVEEFARIPTLIMDTFSKR